jgi:hypothetical protein
MTPESTVSPVGISSRLLSVLIVRKEFLFYCSGRRFFVIESDYGSLLGPISVFLALFASRSSTVGFALISPVFLPASVPMI